MTIKEKIADLIERGAIQLSRKYRLLGLAPVLEEPQTYLSILRERDPKEWANLERIAKEWLLRQDEAFQVKLSIEEFSEWLVQHGQQPTVRPPDIWFAHYLLFRKDDRNEPPTV